LGVAVLWCAVVCWCVLQDAFPDLMQYVRIRVVEMLDHVLATYNPRAGEYTQKLWKRAGERQPHQSLLRCHRDGLLL
jgi:hypothetical protein